MVCVYGCEYVMVCVSMNVMVCVWIVRACDGVCDRVMYVMVYEPCVMYVMVCDRVMYVMVYVTDHVMCV